MNIRINKMLLETSGASDVCRFYQGEDQKKKYIKSCLQVFLHGTKCM
jgi:hypothetical protein